MPDILLQAVNENREAIKLLVQSLEVPPPPIRKSNSFSRLMYLPALLTKDRANIITNVFKTPIDPMSNIENPLLSEGDQTIEEMSSASADPQLPADLALREQVEVGRLHRDQAAAVFEARRKQREAAAVRVGGSGKRKSKRRIPRKRRRPTKRR